MKFEGRKRMNIKKFVYKNVVIGKKVKNFKRNDLEEEKIIRDVDKKNVIGIMVVIENIKMVIEKDKRMIVKKERRMGRVGVVEVGKEEEWINGEKEEIGECEIESKYERKEEIECVIGNR